MNPANPLDSVFFVKLPENFDLSKYSLNVDVNVPIPVQKKDGDESETLNLEELSLEQILSGILTVLAYDLKNENAAYYREILLKARPGVKKELSEAAILKARNEDWDLAEEIWRAVHGIDPEDKAVILNMAIFFDQKADSLRKNALYDDADAYDDLALQNYTEAMASDPEIPDAYFNAGFYYLKKRNYGEVKSCFESYLALTVDLKDSELGENGLYKKERANEILYKIAARNLENEHFHAAYELINSGREEAGLEEIRKFIRDNPAVWNAWFMLGWGLRRLGRYADAKAAFEKALECEGSDENADTLNELAICLIELGEFDAAQEKLAEALDFDPDNTKIISNLGFLSLKQGNVFEAQKYFMTVLEIDPEDKIAKAQLKEFENS